MKPEFSWQAVEKFSNIKFHENSSSTAWLFYADGQTDIHDESVAFRSVANAPTSIVYTWCLRVRAFQAGIRATGGRW